MDKYLTFCISFPSGFNFLQEPTCSAWDLGWEDHLENGTATHSSILAWRIPWTEEPGGLQSMGLQRVGHNLETEQQQDSNVHTFLQFLSLILWLLQKIMSSSQRKMYLSLYAQWLAHSMCSEMSIGWSDWRINERLLLLAFAIFNMSRVVYVQNLTQFFLFFLDQSCPMKI